MITVISCFYNEAPLVPFFLSHYHYVDVIRAIVSQSRDATRELLTADPRVTVEDVEFPAGFDDDIKVSWVNGALGVLPVGWAIVVDADELIFPAGDPTGAIAATGLDAVPGAVDALWVSLEHIYRHVDDQDLDPKGTPVVWQRRHGEAHGRKAAVVRTGRGWQYAVGNHALVGAPVMADTPRWVGAHWQNADPSWAVTRRIRDRKERLSQVNLTKGYGIQHHTLTAADVQAELEAHRHDAVVL